MIAAFWRSPLYVLISITTIVMIIIGSRQSFGLFMQPISSEMGWGREVFSFAIAMQNLLIGLTAPLAAMIADRWGPIRVIAAAALTYSFSVFLMSQAATGEAMLVAGVVSGFALSACSLSLMLSIVGRLAPERRRSLWFGIVTAGGTAGQLVFVPLSQVFISLYDWVTALMVMAASIALVVPLIASVGAGTREALSVRTQQSLGEAVREAGGHSGYWLLVVAFFVCGFQVQFIATHFPAYVVDNALPAALGATAIAMIGLFNMFGTLGFGWLGGRYRQKYLLSALYFMRSMVILGFISLPLTQASVLVFSALIGLLWLGTVPLSSGLVAKVFGTRYMATLYSVVYMSHQLGSFSGVWLGGVIFDVTGSYDQFWWISIALGLVAAVMHLPIDDRPVPRMQAQAAASRP